MGVINQLREIIEKRAVSSVLQGLLDAKRYSDRRDYGGKHHKLRQLMEQHPDDFYIDSVKGDIAGISHLGTGFRVHAPMKILPQPLYDQAHAMLLGANNVSKSNP